MEVLDTKRRQFGRLTYPKTGSLGQRKTERGKAVQKPAHHQKAARDYLPVM